MTFLSEIPPVLPDTPHRHEGPWLRSSE